MLIVGQVLDVPEPEVLLAEGLEIDRLADDRTSLGEDGALAVGLVLAPEAGGAVDVDEDAVSAVGQVDRQAAGLDAEEVLVERLRLERVEGAPDPGVLEAIAASPAVQRRRRDRGEALHHGAGAGAEIERMQPVEDDAGRRVVALEAKVVQEERRQRAYRRCRRRAG